MERPSPVPPPVRKMARPLSKSRSNTFHRLDERIGKRTRLAWDSNATVTITRLFFGGSARQGGTNLGMHRWGYGPGHGFSMLDGVLLAFRKFLTELVEKFLRQFVLLLPARGQP